MDSPDTFSITQSKEYGASKALLELSGTIGLTKILSGTLGEKYKSVLAMIIGMLTYSGSKLSLCNIADFSSVWDLCGIKSPDVDKHCYEVLDRLFDKQKKIQKKLAKKHLSNGSLILYDITSSYFEGEYSDSHMVTYGYNRDKKSGHKQVVIGLVTTADGCYTITTDVAKSELSAEETVSSYRKLAFVEKAFRNLKTASLNIRPIYHRKDERIKSHVFLCMLAYYVQWHLQERMKEFLEINNKNGNQRKYTLEYIIETLKSITRLRVSIKGAEFYQVTKSNDLQSEILQCLGVQFSHADTNL
jgi:hypothetical protein